MDFFPSLIQENVLTTYTPLIGTTSATELTTFPGDVVCHFEEILAPLQTYLLPWYILYIRISSRHQILCYD